MQQRLRKAAQAFETVCETMAILRAPGGCPWDAEQTLASLKPYLIEEAFETVDAMDQGDTKAHCEELGDVLLQVIFQAEIAQETGAFDVADVACALDAKLKRRHPDVFASPQAPAQARPQDAQNALDRWEAIKAAERPRRKGRLSGVPKGMPALVRALRTSQKAASTGFDWPTLQGSLDKVAEEMGELREAIQDRAAQADNAAIESEMGDVLFSLVNVCRRLDIDPEAALRGTINRFHHRFEHVEQRLDDKGLRLEDTPLDAINELWEEAKTVERAATDKA